MESTQVQELFVAQGSPANLADVLRVVPSGSRPARNGGWTASGLYISITYNTRTVTYNTRPVTHNTRTVT